MAHLSQKLAEMHRRLSEAAQEEQQLILRLNAALNHVDEALLTEIRHVTAQHEARRGVIMNELQLLATRICSFPAVTSEPAPAALEEDPRNVTSNSRLARPVTHSPGDWRMAAQNVEDDDLDFFTDGPPN
jgi:hypothetical protein